MTLRRAAGRTADLDGGGVASRRERPADRLRSVGRTLLLAAGYLAGWTALDFAAALYQVAPDVSVWYPPTALDLVVLLVLGPRYALLLPLSTVVHAALVSPVGLTPGEVTALTVVTTAGYAATAVALLYRARIDPRLPTQRDVVWFVWLGCAAGPLLVAAGQVLVLTAAGVVPGSQFLVSVAGHWAGVATGVGVFAPFLLVASRRSSRLWADRPPLPPDPPAPDAASEPGRGGVGRGGVGRGERLAQVAVSALAVWVAYGLPAGGSLDLTYVVYVPLIWVAVRGGFAQITVWVLLVNVAVAALNAGRVASEGGIVLQFGLVTLTLSGLLLGALISQRWADAERHRSDAVHDPLTGLPNRVLFADRLAQAAGRADRRPEHRFAVLFLDLDRFKSVNDGLGHAAGDRLLIEVAHRLRAVTRPGDSVARFGGDEFAVLLDDLAEPAELAHAAERVLATLARPHAINGVDMVVTASVGSALSGPDAHRPTELLRDADVALHRAKSRGRAQHVVFDQAMHRQAVESLRLESALRRAIEFDRIDVAIQPVLALPGRQLVAVEALARWTPPGGTPVPPLRFVALAEETGLVAALGLRVLHRACAAVAGWRDDGHADRGDADPGRAAPRVAVNVSPSELRRPDYVDQVRRILRDTGLPPARLELEITESQWMEQAETAPAALEELAGMGVRLVIDDFGTGYSSFGYLRHLPVTGLKIDRSFVAGLPQQADQVAIVEAILAMAAKLGLEVTAEGVETPEQLAFLVEHGCPQAQGYLLGRPVPASTMP